MALKILKWELSTLMKLFEPWMSASMTFLSKQTAANLRATVKLLPQLPWLNLWQSLQHALDHITRAKCSLLLLFQLFFTQKKYFKNLGINLFTMIYLEFLMISQGNLVARACFGGENWSSYRRVGQWVGISSKLSWKKFF